MRYAMLLFLVCAFDSVVVVMKNDSPRTFCYQGLKQACDEFNAKKEDDGPAYEYGIIVCALRMIFPELSPYYADLMRTMELESHETVAALASQALATAAVHARDVCNLPIVALDIAGAEAVWLFLLSDLHCAYVVSIGYSSAGIFFLGLPWKVS